MERYEYIMGGYDDLEIIKSLWDRFNDWHYDVSDSFSNRFRNVDWEKTKKNILEESRKILVDFVKDTEEDKIVGFCITRIYRKESDAGEIDMLFVDNDYRTEGIGKNLIDRAIEWLDKEGIKKKRLYVASGNESIMEYYNQFGFEPLYIIMQRKET